MLGLVLKTVVVTIGCLVAADLAGALALTLVDILDLRGNSPVLPYAVWLVLGVFCGLLAYNFAGAWVLKTGAGSQADWTAAPGAQGLGTGILIVSGLLIAGLAWLFYLLEWKAGVSGEYYVPDSEPLTIVFFLSVLGAMAVGRFMLMPTAEKPS